MADIDGTPGDDTLFGTEDNDRIRGLAGNDFLLGFGGTDTLEGGDGDDQLAGGGGSDLLQGGNGNDVLAGDSGFEISGIDTLTGGAGADQFEWDPFAGTSTAVLTDIVSDFQGAGNTIGDTLEFVSFSAPIRLTFGGKLAAMPSLGGALGTGGDSLAAVSYAFSGGNTFVLADTNDNGSYDVGDLTIRLNGQLNLVQSDFGSTRFVIAGTNGADTLNGTQGNDTILGLGGNDTINGRAGDDVIEGGNGADTLNGGDGNDRIQGGNGADVINGGEGRDFLTGDAGNDFIDGGAGDDSVLAGGDGNDTVSGGAGNDNVDGDAGDDTLSGGVGNDDLFGLDGNDSMFGDGGDDELFGGEGNDQLSGGAGIDELEGEEGADRIESGGGNDQINFNAGAFQPDSTFSVRDFVLDFQRAGLAGGDEIRLSGDEFAWVGQINANPRIGAALPGGGDELTQLGYIQRAGNTFLVADSNDDGLLDANDFMVEFAGLQNFTTGDFTSSTDFIIAGTNGDDVITGTPGDDRIFAAGGNDQVTALAGDDEVHGGAGDDILDGGPGGFDNLFGDAGNDRLTLATSDGGGTASGGDGDDVLFGSDTSFNNFDNTVQGDAGNDELHAGAVGSSMSGGSGSDRLISGAADDQMDAGRDEFGFDLDNAQDLFVYTGTGRWSTEGSFFGDTVSGFQDGSDLFDLRGSGLQFGDIAITNEDFQTTITSDRGKITIFESFGQEVFLDQDDFLFDSPPAPITSGLPFV